MIAVFKDQSTLDHIAQLTNISGPFVFSEYFGSFRRQALDLFTPLEAGADRIDVVLRQQQDVVTAFAKWRDIDLNNRETIIKVESKRPASLSVFKSRLDAPARDVKRNVFQATDTTESSFFQDAQSFACKRKFQLTDFIEQAAFRLRLARTVLLSRAFASVNAPFS